MTHSDYRLYVAMANVHQAETPRHGFRYMGYWPENPYLRLNKQQRTRVEASLWALLDCLPQTDIFNRRKRLLNQRFRLFMRADQCCTGRANGTNAKAKTALSTTTKSSLFAK